MVFEQEDKSQFGQALLLAGSNSKLKVFLNDDVINSTKYEKLRVIIHSKLNFSSHNNVMCKKNRTKNVCIFQNNSTHRIAEEASLNAFFICQCSYCSLVWMWYRRIKNNMINGLHERCFRIIFSFLSGFSFTNI